MKSGYQNQIPLKPSALATPSKESVAKQLGKASKLESEKNYSGLANTAVTGEISG